MEKKKISYWYTDRLGNPEDALIYKWLCEKYDVILDEIDPDFLFYDVFGDEFLRYNNSVRIFIPTETEMPNFNQCDYAVGCADIQYLDRYFRYNYEYPNITPAYQDRSSVTDDLVNRKFCNFVYSNASTGEGALLRQEFCKRLMKYKHVDCPGKVLNNMDSSAINPRSSADWKNGVLDFKRKYKFTIAFENEATDGWVTEKLSLTFKALSLPIYYGSPSVNRDFNPKSFVNIADYDFDLDKVVERIVYLDTHDDEYLAMLREKPLQDSFQFFDANKYKQWIFHIIEKGRRPFNKDPREVSSHKERMAKAKIWYFNQKGLKDTSLAGKLRDIIQATKIPNESIAALTDLTGQLNNAIQASQSTDLIDKLDKMIKMEEANQTSYRIVMQSCLQNQNSLHEFLNEYFQRASLRKKYRFRLMRYRLLKHITFGKMKKKYKEKYKKLKNKICSPIKC